MKEGDSEVALPQGSDKKSEELFAGVSAYFSERAVNTDIQSSLASLAERTRREIARIYTDSHQRLQRMEPTLTVKPPASEAGIESFIEYLKGKKFHDPTEHQ